MLPEFRNEPFTDFDDPENARRMEEALDRVRGELGRTYPMVIGGEEEKLADTFDSVNPAEPLQVIGRFPNGGAEHADRAIEAAERAFEAWRRVPAAERARYLVDAAAAMRERKFDLAALMVLEVSKSWAEADGDVAEAIDFAEYYARQMLRLAEGAETSEWPGEDNRMVYIPLGVTAVIPPWNFPLAIMAGMTLAALVAGNTVVLKPAEQSPTIAAWFVDIMRELGLPDGVLNFVTGPGEVVGERMVDHPRTRVVAFTGSKAVGTRIYERAARVHPGQKWLKRAVLEMGGKDALVVDETADLDAAAASIVASAFGFQGQKCSACSRAILVEDVYDEVAEKVVSRARELRVGDPSKAGSFMGAVIDDEAFEKIKGYIAIGKEEGRLLLGGDATEPSDGYFVEPTVIGEVAPDARLAQEEVFGPVLALIKAADYEDALRIANSTEFGLTGGVFSDDRDRLERAREDFHVGNLYLNRKITGALVGVQPFGGFNMSGTDSKAGGPDYLLLFTQPKTISERVD
ncbi:MAG TPA: L-glutamate gamma-semialdehyde dehydrogenase [Longimicrobiales bacterium]|nr:L-glutamate gamma-semialdehyde dehydrogenase [Longimicrobiales bacterium]